MKLHPFQSEKVTTKGLSSGFKSQRGVILMTCFANMTLFLNSSQIRQNENTGGTLISFFLANSTYKGAKKIHTGTVVRGKIKAPVPNASFNLPTI